MLIPAITGQNQDGTVSVAGKTVSTNNLKLRGNVNAEIVLVEFSDYQCSFCAAFHNTPKSIVATSNGKVAWAWKHFPLGFHPEAMPAAIAGECVNKLGGPEKFWSFSDTMMVNQSKLSTAFYQSEVAKLGLNTSAFNTCLADPKMKTNVETEQNEGATLGVNGTPNTLVIKNENGVYTVLESINGALPEATVQSIVDKYTK
jgi:protein-disulfide isomerase